MALSPNLGYIFEGVLCLAGVGLMLIVGWRRRQPGPPPPLELSPWPGGASDFALYLCFAFLGVFFLSGAAQGLVKLAHLGADDAQIWLNLAFHLGVVLGVAGFSYVLPRFRPETPPGKIGPIRSGAITFLIALPIVLVVMLGWRWFLGRVGFEARDQDVVDLFQNIHRPVMKALFVILAVGIAPCSEELIFRAGIFRYLRLRLPRVWAVAISATLFGALHLVPSPADGLGSLLPLIVLGALLALAYERTGRIGTVIFAHAMFNLNTLVSLRLGMPS
jgi:membrane protease YdiL (CAAX protease family)